MPDQPGAPSQDGRPDLNDPNVRIDRAAAMKLMTESRRESVQQDMDPGDAAAFRESVQAAPGEQAAPEPAADDPTTPAARAAQVDRQTAQPIILDEGDLANYRVRKKVNGVETIVGVDELRTSAQKVDAADEYLAKAKTTLAELDAVTKQARAMASQATPQTQPATPSAQAPSPTDSGPDPIDAAVDHLFGGDDAKAKEALRQALKAQPTAAQEPDALARDVEQRVVIRSALRQFAKDHRDIAADPTLRRKADEFLYQELGNRGVTKLEDLDADQIPDVIAQAGTQTKDWLRSVAGVPATPTPTQAPSLDDKRRAKQGIDELPAASVRSSSMIAPPRTTADTIAAMAAARNPMSNPRAS